MGWEAEFEKRFLIAPIGDTVKCHPDLLNLFRQQAIAIGRPDLKFEPLDPADESPLWE